MGRLHGSRILLLLPESSRVLFSFANLRFYYLNLTGITKFKLWKKENEMNSGVSSKTRNRPNGLLTWLVFFLVSLVNINMLCPL